MTDLDPRHDRAAAIAAEIHRQHPRLLDPADLDADPGTEALRLICQALAIRVMATEAAIAGQPAAEEQALLGILRHAADMAADDLAAAVVGAADLGVPTLPNPLAARVALPAEWVRFVGLAKRLAALSWSDLGDSPARRSERARAATSVIRTAQAMLAEGSRP